MMRDETLPSKDLAPTQRATSPNTVYVLAVLSLLMGFASISTDFYLPAMPAMADALGASHGMVEFTVTGYLIGFTAGQLAWGPLSDRHGRRLPIAVGLAIFVIGSLGCAWSDRVEAIIVWRVVQALGASASVVLARAMVRDLYHGARAAQMMSTLMAVMAAAPLIGPLAGAQVEAWAGWRAIFLVLAVVGAVTLIALFTIRETLPASARRQEGLAQAMQRYSRLLGQRRVLGYVGVGGFFYAGMFAYIAGSPFAYIDFYGVPSHYYGVLFALGILGIMGMNLFNVRLVSKHGIDRTLAIGAGLAAVMAMAVGIAAFTGWGRLWGLAIPLSLFLACAGLIAGNSIAGALNDFPREAGAVSALTGALLYGGGMVGTALVGAFADGSPKAMGGVIAGCGIGSLLCTRLLAADKSAPPTHRPA